MNSESILSVVERHAEQRGDNIAYTYLDYKNRDLTPSQQDLTFREIYENVKHISSHFRLHSSVGDRAILVYPPGLDFICVFLACLDAGVVPIPVPMPRFGFGFERLNNIVEDSGAKYVLSSKESSLKSMEEKVNVGTLEYFNTERWNKEIPSDTESDYKPKMDDIAFIQYSSGSTGRPKGVVITHKSFIQQEKLLFKELGNTENSCAVSWLPHFHDLGLILGVFQPLFGGFRSILMAPEAFILNPLRWLRAVQEFSADGTTAPNFAYDLCLRSLKDSEIDELNLSSLRFLGITAEPIRAKTIKQFVRKFERCGINIDTFYTGYGLAEATLLVTAKSLSNGISIEHFEASQLEKNIVEVVDEGEPLARAMVSSGRPVGGFVVKIVNPDSLDVLRSGHVGEVWLAQGPMGKGYWNKEDSTASTFSASCNDETTDGYLRTGDLGFLYKGELYLCGRIKDLILIRGMNHHASDIEASIAGCHPALNPEGCAAFSCDIRDEERLVVVQELNRTIGTLTHDEKNSIASEISKKVASAHEINVYSVVLLSRGIPKTTSGKIQRQECKQRYMNGLYDDYKFLQAAQMFVKNDQSVKNDSSVDSGPDERVREVKSWILSHICAHGCDEELVSSGGATVAELLSSSNAVRQLSDSIKIEFGCTIPPAIVGDFDSITELADYILKRKDGAKRNSIFSAAELESSFAINRKKALDEPIAIVGVGCRFPKAKTTEEFWENLCNGVDAVTEIPPERWDIDALYDENPLAIGKMNTRRAGLLDDIELFDRNFFGLSVRETTRMDPAHRLLMEIAWEVFQDSGTTREMLDGSNTAVFIGISGSDYAQLQFGDESLADAYAGLGSALTNSASRISHHFNLRGPALAVDTACSSSLTAVHMACKSIRQGDTEMALAGGVNILLSPNITLSLTKAGMMAPDGKCKTFDAKADGYVRAEGAGLVLLKPLSSAIRDGDEIYALVKGSASNQDGKSSGIAAPNGQAQQQVVMDACRDAGVEPGWINYVEAHGTGTALGDPIEVNALGEVLKIGAAENTYCTIGSVKTNIGHSESAAGIASIIKASLILKNKKIPPSLNFEEPNPAIPFADLRVKVQTSLTSLTSDRGPALIGVNSFGVGGTNVHVILEESISTQSKENSDSSNPENSALFLLPLSGHNVNSLKSSAKNLATYLKSKSKADLLDIFYTLSQRRFHLMHRVSVLGRDSEELISALEGYSDVGFHENAFYGNTISHKENSKVGYIFSGQGSQWFGMGLGLFDSEPVFRNAIERCDKALHPYTGWSLLEVLRGSDGKWKLDETEYAQPAIFAIQVALTELWESRGFSPGAVVGHSLGEITAAYVAGAIDFDDACSLVSIRAKLMQKTTGNGSMVSFEATFETMSEEVTAFSSRLSIAAINGPKTVVVSGDIDAMESLVVVMESKGVICVKLPVNYAFHSQQMEQSKRQLVEALEDIPFKKPLIPVYSTVTGKRMADAPIESKYWGDNLREKVVFKQAIESMAADGFEHFLEVSAHPVLSNATDKILKSIGKPAHCFQSLDKKIPDDVCILGCFARLHASGCGGAWRSIHAGGEFIRGLPSYAWDKERYWLDGPHVEARTRRTKHPLLIERLPIATPTWQIRLDTNIHPFLNAVRFEGKSRLLTGIVLEALAATWSLSTGSVSHVCLKNVVVNEPSYLEEGGSLPSMQATLTTDTFGILEAKIFIQKNQNLGRAFNWLEVASAEIDPETIPATSYKKASVGITVLKSDPDGGWQGDVLYQRMSESGVEVSSSAQLVDHFWLSDGRSIARITAVNTDKWIFSPLLFEAIEQAGRLSLGLGYEAYNLNSIGRIRTFDSLSKAAYVVCEKEKNTPKDLVNVLLIDKNENVICQLDRLNFRRNPMLGANQQSISADPENWLYDFEWKNEAATNEIKEGSGDGRKWIIFADRSGVATQFASFLNYHDESYCLIYCSEKFEKRNDTVFEIPAACAESVARVLKEYLNEGDQHCAGVAHFWNLDATAVKSAELDDVVEHQAAGVVNLAAITRALSELNVKGRPRLWTITAGSQPAGGISDCEYIQAPVWGLSKCLVIEHPELRPSRIDLSSHRAESEIRAMCKEIFASEAEDQIAFRGEDRFVSRLVPSKKPMVEDSAEDKLSVPTEPFLLSIVQTQDSEAFEVKLERYRRSAPQSNHCEIQIELGAVRRTMNPTEDIDVARRIICDTCVGTVTQQTGQGASDLSGQRVVALTDTALSVFQNVKTDAIRSIPPELESEVVAGSLRPFMIAQLALDKVAATKRGQYVLINGIDSEIGSALFHVAVSLGAKIIATYEKFSNDLLLDHRSILYHFPLNEREKFEQLEKLTSNRGIDVLVNCVADMDFSIVAPALGGFAHCFDLSLSRRGNLQNPARLNFTSNISFHALDLDAVIREVPELASELMDSALEKIKKSTFSIARYDVCDIANIQAIDFLNNHRELVRLHYTVADEFRPIYKSDASYLITGGLGGLGLSVANRIASRGAKSIILIGRRSPSLNAMDEIAKIERKGVRVSTFSADVANEEDVEKLLKEVASTLPPVRGVFHAAGTLANALVTKLEKSDFDSTFASKLQGTVNLDKHLVDDGLDFFIMFSSLASAIGSPGQSNYAAANAFLDSFAHHRASLGKKGLSVSWGPWEEVGMAAGESNLKKLSDHGFGTIPLQDGLDLMEQFIEEDRQGSIAVLPMNWALWAKYHQHFAQLPYVSEVVPEPDIENASIKKITSSQIENLDTESQIEQIKVAIQRAVCQAMMLDIDSVQTSVPITSIGLDSIVALELKTRIEFYIDVVVQTSTLLKGLTIDQLADSFRKQLILGADARSAEKTSVANSDTSKQEIEERVEELSTEEIDDLLKEMAEEV